MTMTTRDLFRRIMRFEAPDRTPLWQVEGVTEQAERKWCRDGETLVDRLGAPTIGFDCKLLTWHFRENPPIPAFFPHTLERNEDFVTHQDQYGFHVKTQTGSDVSPIHYVYVKGSLSTLEDWRKIRDRFDPEDPRRLPMWWGDEMVDLLNNSTSPTVLGMPWGPARGIKNGYMFGFERFMELLIDEPYVLEEVFDFWTDYTIRLLRRFIHLVQVDAFMFIEDGMGFKNSTLASPQMFRRIYAPYMGKVVEFLQSHDVRVVGYYSSGNLTPLLKEFLSIGINAITPVEYAAGMDAVELRREYGRDLLMIGNIARQALMDGKEAVEAEVARKIPFLMESGGYIPAFDDAIMPDMTLDVVRYCASLVKSCVPSGAELHEEASL